MHFHSYTSRLDPPWKIFLDPRLGIPKLKTALWHGRRIKIMRGINIQGQLIAVVLRGNDLAIVYFVFIIFYEPVDVQIWTLLTRRQWRMSVTQVAVKAKPWGSFYFMPPPPCFAPVGFASWNRLALGELESIVYFNCIFLLNLNIYIVKRDTKN